MNEGKVVVNSSKFVCTGECVGPIKTIHTKNGLICGGCGLPVGQIDYDVNGQVILPGLEVKNQNDSSGGGEETKKEVE